MSNELLLIIYFTGCVVFWMVLYVYYNLAYDEDKKSSGFPMLSIAMLSIAVFAWPIGLIMAIPVFMFLMIGDIIVTQIKKRRGNEQKAR